MCGEVESVSCLTKEWDWGPRGQHGHANGLFSLPDMRRLVCAPSRDGVRLCKGHAELFDRVMLAAHVYGAEMVELWQDGKFTGTFVRKSQ
jgi:hypothetical protein